MNTQVFKAAMKNYLLSHTPYPAQNVHFNPKLFKIVNIYVNSSNNYAVIFVPLFYLY